MTRYFGSDYEPEAEDNQAVGSALITRFPEHWTGDRVNGAMAAMASAVRNESARALHAPVGEDGVPVSQQAGTAALQNADDISFTGGILTNVRGAVPIGTVIFYGRTWATYQTEFATLFNAGWVVCDGRTVTNPYTGALQILPDLIGRYGLFATTGSLTASGATTQATSANGNHSHGGATAPDGVHAHGGNTGAHALTAGEIPLVSATTPIVSGAQSVAGVNPQTASGHVHSIPASAAHTHGITSDGNHNHIVQMAPLSTGLIPLMRVW